MFLCILDGAHQPRHRWHSEQKTRRAPPQLKCFRPLVVRDTPPRNRRRSASRSRHSVTCFSLYRRSHSLIASRCASRRACLATNWHSGVREQTPYLLSRLIGPPQLQHGGCGFVSRLLLRSTWFRACFLNVRQSELRTQNPCLASTLKGPPHLRHCRFSLSR